LAHRLTKLHIGLRCAKGAVPFLGDTDMGRFDSRNTNKTRQRKAQAKKKAREARRAEETRVARQGK